MGQTTLFPRASFYDGKQQGVKAQRTSLGLNVIVILVLLITLRHSGNIIIRVCMAMQQMYFLIKSTRYTKMVETETD